jgi:hypothetical protein
MAPLEPHRPLLPWERTLQWWLFLLVMLCSLHGQWLAHGHDPYEFLRHGNDQLGYYQWLPATFIDHDHYHMYWAHPLLNGASLSMFTIGVALLELPFFLLGHWAAWSFGYAMDGFSAPYGVAIMIGCGIYAGIGCVLAFKLARRFSDTMPALLAVVVLFAGTNLFRYLVYEPTMSHLFSFMLIGLYAWCGLRVLDGPRPVHVFALVASGLLIVLIRQTNVFSLLFPLLAAGSREGVRLFFRNLCAHPRPLALAVVLGLVPWVLQMVYWHAITGSAITYTYGAKDERFEWDKMVPGLVLFSVRNGWLVYTPLMIVVLVMLVRRAWQGVRPARTILFHTVVCLVFYSAWWCWWLGSSYGHRGFVDLYALLVIPLAWCMAWVRRGSLVRRTVATVVLVVLVHLNLELVQRYDWWWSGLDWNWRLLFEQVGEIALLK